MRDEWNAGYEKGRDDYCCNHDCNQGRDCPVRKLKAEIEALKDKLHLAQQSLAIIEGWTK